VDDAAAGWDELTAAGLYDPAAPDAGTRRELLAFLLEEGCTVEEMQVAQSRGRLFALAGDRRIRPLVGLLTLREAAERLGVDVPVLARAWRTFGLPEQGVDTPLLTDEDVEALGTYADIRAFLGDDTALGLARVAGAAVARITEAESSAMRAGMEGVIDISVTGDEVKTARAYAAVTQLVPRVGQLLDRLHRQHLEATRVHFEDIFEDISENRANEADERTAFRCGVGFADLSGFTRLSQQLPLQQLSEVLSVFEETATDTVHTRGGRIVKFLGDAVMWVSARPEDLARVAHDLVTHPRAALAGIEVRAGIAYGRVLAQDGDYFGTPVNLASRLVSVAEAGQVLAPRELLDLLPDRHGEGWTGVPGVAVALRGFDDPVVPWVLTPA
jgi:class 3 adenylate cyclase